MASSRAGAEPHDDEARCACGCPLSSLVFVVRPGETLGPRATCGVCGRQRVRRVSQRAADLVTSPFALFQRVDRPAVRGATGRPTRYYFDKSTYQAFGDRERWETWKEASRSAMQMHANRRIDAENKRLEDEYRMAPRTASHRLTIESTTSLTGSSTSVHVTSYAGVLQPTGTVASSSTFNNTPVQQHHAHRVGNRNPSAASHPPVPAAARKADRFEEHGLRFLHELGERAPPEARGEVFSTLATACARMASSAPQRRPPSWGGRVEGAPTVRRFCADEPAPPYYYDQPPPRVGRLDASAAMDDDSRLDETTRALRQAHGFLSAGRVVEEAKRVVVDAQPSTCHRCDGVSDQPLLRCTVGHSIARDATIAGQRPSVFVCQLNLSSLPACSFCSALAASSHPCGACVVVCRRQGVMDRWQRGARWCDAHRNSAAPRLTLSRDGVLCLLCVYRRSAPDAWRTCREARRSRPTRGSVPRAWAAAHASAASPLTAGSNASSRGQKGRRSERRVWPPMEWTCSSRR
jgi:hypothetical protein